MNKNEMLSVVESVLRGFGTPVFLEPGAMGENTVSYATLETLFSVRTDAQGTTFAEDLKAKIAAHLHMMETEGVTRSYNGHIHRLHNITQAPRFTYREPSVNEIPNGVLYSVSIGFPMFVA